MKRDARIGLAVVLVLGLAVTLLVARAIAKRGEVAGADPETAGPRDAVAYSADIPKVDGLDAAQVAAVPVTPNPAPAQPTDAAARPPADPNPALQKFLDDQSRHLSPSGSAATKSNTSTPPATGETVLPGGSANNTPRPAPNGGAQAPVDPTLLFDHEQAGPAAAEPQVPKDGYGYIVVAGDNIWKISSKVYGDGRYTQKIADANAGMNSQKMKPGSIIRIPIIPNKTILMKLPSFADAGKEIAKAKTPDKAVPADPAVAAKNVVAPEKAAADTSAATMHKIESGETLSSIARKYYGSSGPKTIAMITGANKGLDPAKLKVGQEIAIPPKK